MSPKTTPKAERPSAGRLPEIAGRAVALTELDMRGGLLTRHLSVPDMLLVVRGVNVHVDRKRCSVALPEPRRVSTRPGGSTVRSRMAHLGHEDQFPLPSLNDRCRLGEETFAGMGDKEEHAPIPGIRGSNRGSRPI
jgi:hypothetical protein